MAEPTQVQQIREWVAANDRGEAEHDTFSFGPGYASELLAYVDHLRAEIRDGRQWMQALVQDSNDPGTGALAWLHRNERFSG